MDRWMDDEARIIINNIFDKKIYIKPVGNHHLGRHMVYVVTNQNNKSCVFKLYFKKNRWNREVATLKLLTSSKIKVPKLIDYGVYNKKEWIITEFIEGSTFSSIQEEIGVKNQIHIFREMGKELAKIHNIKVFDFWGNWDENGKSLEIGMDYKDVFQKRYHSVLEKIFEKDIPYKNLHKKSIQYIEKNMNLIDNIKKPVLCHNDFCIRNVILKNIDQAFHVMGIIDFEQSFPADKDLDMAYLYYTLLLKNKKYEKAFIEGYKEEGTLEESFKIKLKFYLIYTGLYICSWSYHRAFDYYMQGIRILQGCIEGGELWKN